MARRRPVDGGLFCAESTMPLSPRAFPTNTNVPEILDFSVAASTSEWEFVHSLALAATSRPRVQKLKAIGISQTGGVRPIRQAHGRRPYPTFPATHYSLLPIRDICRSPRLRRRWRQASRTWRGRRAWRAVSSVSTPSGGPSTPSGGCRARSRAARRQSRSDRRS